MIAWSPTPRVFPLLSNRRRRYLTLATLGILYIVTLAGLGQPSDKSAKHVTIDKTYQVLRAFEGNRLVLQCRVSTGRGNSWTPNGDFTAGVKSLMHYSSLFHNAPMPYSVQVTGNVFIHGFADVPDWPASHGCIRVPLDGDNPAKKFYYWIDTGTPIHITGQWNGPPKALPALMIEPLN